MYSGVFGCCCCFHYHRDKSIINFLYLCSGRFLITFLSVHLCLKSELIYAVKHTQQYIICLKKH